MPLTQHTGHARVPSARGRRWHRHVCAALLAGVLTARLSAAILYWDTNGTTAGAGTANGTWSTGGGATNNRWNTIAGGGSGGTIGKWTSGSDAVFSAGSDDTGSYTVTLAAIENVSSIKVEEGSPTLSSKAVNFNDASPDVLVAAGSTLTLSVAPTSSTNGLNLGSATYTGTTVFSSNTTLSGTVNLAGGTLRLSGTSYTFGTLNVTGNSTIDFAGATTLNVSTLTISAGVTLNILNWSNAADFFYATSWTGAVADTTGTTPMNQVAFNGFSASNTRWISYDQQVSPVPEPAVQGVLLLLFATGATLTARRLLRRPAA